MVLPLHLREREPVRKHLVTGLLDYVKKTRTISPFIAADVNIAH